MKIRTKVRLALIVAPLVPIFVLLALAGGPGNEAVAEATASAIGLSLLLALATSTPVHHWMIGKRLREIRSFCRNVKNGDYREDLKVGIERSDSADEHEIGALMRDLNWMVHRIRNREEALAEAVDEAKRANASLLEQKKIRDGDLERARIIQEHIAGQNREESREWSHSFLLKMAFEVGGDLYQEFHWRESRSCLMACFDVSGKALAASLVTGIISGFFAALRRGTAYMPRPETLANDLNAYLSELLPLGTFVTGVLIFAPEELEEGSEIRILNFGYAPVYLFRPDEDGRVQARALEPTLPPLGLEGVLADEDSVQKADILQGLNLFIFSDGMTDLKAPDGRRYGEKQLVAFMARNRNRPAGEFIGILEEEIASWKQEAPQADDITALAIRFPPARKAISRKLALPPIRNVSSI